MEVAAKSLDCASLKPDLATIQTYFLPGIEDEIGEISEELKRFVGIC